MVIMINCIKYQLIRRNHRVYPFPSRLLSSNPNTSKDKPSDDSLRKSIQELNKVIAENSTTAFVVFLAIRNMSWMMIAGIYSMSYFSFGSELAVGYVVAKLSAKFRQPANIAVAAALSRTFPILSEIKIGSLLTGLPMPNSLDTNTNIDNNTSNSNNNKSKNTSKPTSLFNFSKGMSDLAKWGAQPIDKYGFSYFLAGRVNIFTTIIGTATALHYGLDITSILSSLGFSESLQSGAGIMGAAFITNFFLLPIHFHMLSSITPLLGSYARLIVTSLKKMNQIKKSRT